MGYKLNFAPDFPELLFERDVNKIKAENRYPEYFIKLNHFVRERHFKRIAD